jgi:hypothetical protein
MTRRSSMCEECPFRTMHARDKARVAGEDAEAWTCHMEEAGAAFGESEIHCRGHWEARRKFSPQPSTTNPQPLR